MPFTGNVFSLLWNFGQGTPLNNNNFPIQLGEDLTDIASALTTLKVSVPTTIVNLPGAPATGQIAAVSDGDPGLAWGAIVVNSGAGATKYLVWYNGTNWTVIGE